LSQPFSSNYNSSSLITKYVYKGVPEETKADIRAVPVKLRKMKLEE
jgi:hypothetical protein